MGAKGVKQVMGIDNLSGPFPQFIISFAALLLAKGIKVPDPPLPEAVASCAEHFRIVFC